MCKCTILLLLVFSFSFPALAQEKLMLTTPEPGASNTTWQVRELHLGWKVGLTDYYIHLRLAGDNDERIECQWIGEIARAMIVVLNTANLSNNSLHKRALSRAQVDGGDAIFDIDGEPTGGFEPCLAGGNIAGSSER